FALTTIQSATNSGDRYVQDVNLISVSTLTQNRGLATATYITLATHCADHEM
ncbi:hypothetical protein RDWZM_002847, partial [Blomia tropicalis]